MKIAVASGKGGTGKTTISVNLAWYLGMNSDSVGGVCYLDCDVEEPNGHLFLRPQISKAIDCSIKIPFIDTSKCSACGACVRSCEFKALVRIGKEVIVIDDLCHGCGGCTLVCPEKAISEREKRIGVVETGQSQSIGFAHGRLDVGRAMSPPLIRQVLSYVKPDETIYIIDSPPGTSCPVISSIKNADFVLLVTEPTPFGLNDLGLALDMVNVIGLPHAVVVNRSDSGISDARDFCESKGVSIIAEIANDRKIAELTSSGALFIEQSTEYVSVFAKIWAEIKRRI